MPANRSVEILCPAKVNLALSVGPPTSTPAGSFHPIASWMAALDFGDRLTLARLDVGAAPAAGGDRSASRFDLAFAGDAPAPGKVDWPLGKDLCFRAHHLMERRAGRALPVHLKLSKRIPAGAGLGGGSSNAAATIVGLNRLFQLELDAASLMQLGATLGSDVAFLVGAVLGETSALVEGLGEKIAPLPLATPVHLVLIFPPFGCPTGPVYKAFDQLHPAATLINQPDAQRVRHLADHQPLTADAPFNDLAEPAFVVAPALRDLAAKVQSALRLPVHVSGSGSTLFVLLPDAAAATSAARQITTNTGLPAVAARTLSSDVARQEKFQQALERVNNRLGSTLKKLAE